MFQFNNKTIKQYINKCRGMTLIEVLVVVAIILILLGAVVINPRPSVNLDRAARQLASDLRRAQNMAMSAVEQGPIGSEYVPCGYGIYVTNSTSYVLFYNNGGDCSTDTYKHNGSTDFETADLGDIASGITITVGVGKSIYFIPPSGTTYINGSEGGIVSQNFTLAASDGSTRTVTVTSAGKIEIQ